MSAPVPPASGGSQSRSSSSSARAVEVVRSSGWIAALLALVAVLTFMGFLQLGTGCLLMTAASKHLSATELGLLALLEPIIGPIWVWALMAERPDAAALTGGVIVLCAVIANELFAAWTQRPAVAAGVPPVPPGA